MKIAGLFFGVGVILSILINDATAYSSSSSNGMYGRGVMNNGGLPSTTTTATTTMKMKMSRSVANDDVIGGAMSRNDNDDINNNCGVGTTDRRSWMKTSARTIMSSFVVGAGGSTSVLSSPAPSFAEELEPSSSSPPPSPPSPKRDGVISSKFCAYGQGEGCTDLAEGNPLILELQRRSSQNKQQIITDAQNAYFNKNYPDFMKAVGKTMVQKGDSSGTYVLMDDLELAKLKQEGKITLVYPKTLNGKLTDLTQKPIPLLKE